MAAGGRPTFLTNRTQGVAAMRYSDCLEKGLKDPLEADAYLRAYLEDKDSTREDILTAFENVSRIYTNSADLKVFFAFDPTPFDHPPGVVWVAYGRDICFVVDIKWLDTAHPIEWLKYNFYKDCKANEYKLIPYPKNWMTLNEKMFNHIYENLCDRDIKYRSRICG